MGRNEYSRVIPTVERRRQWDGCCGAENNPNMQ